MEQLYYFKILILDSITEFFSTIFYSLPVGLVGNIFDFEGSSILSSMSLGFYFIAASFGLIFGLILFKAINIKIDRETSLFSLLSDWVMNKRTIITIGKSLKEGLQKNFISLFLVLVVLGTLYIPFEFNGQSISTIGQLKTAINSEMQFNVNQITSAIKKKDSAGSNPDITVDKIDLQKETCTSFGSLKLYNECKERNMVRSQIFNSITNPASQKLEVSDIESQLKRDKEFKDKLLEVKKSTLSGEQTGKTLLENLNINNLNRTIASNKENEVSQEIRKKLIKDVNNKILAIEINIRSNIINEDIFSSEKPEETYQNYKKQILTESTTEFEDYKKELDAEYKKLKDQGIADYLGKSESDQKYYILGIVIKEYFIYFSLLLIIGFKTILLIVDKILRTMTDGKKKLITIEPSSKDEGSRIILEEQRIIDSQGYIWLVVLVGELLVKAGIVTFLFNKI